MGKYALFLGCLIPMKNPQIEKAARRVFEALKLDVVDVQGFSCCPEPWNFKGASLEEWLLVAGRNLFLARKNGRDIIALCNGCSATLIEANHLLAEGGIEAKRVLELLKKRDVHLDGKVRAAHAVEVLYRDLGVDKVAKSCSAPLKGLKVAVHYGCHLLRPSEIMNVDDPFSPTMLDQLVEATGAESLPYRDKMACCGSASMNKDVSLGMARKKLMDMEEVGAQALVVTCPACFDQFDLGQIEVNRKFKESHSLPVLHYFQLLALAQGSNSEEVGLSRHKIKAKELNKVISR